MDARRTRETELEWWLASLGIKDRDLYRQLRELAWEFVVENSGRSDKPNKPS